MSSKSQLNNEDALYKGGKWVFRLALQSNVGNSSPIAAHGWIQLGNLRRAEAGSLNWERSGFVPEYMEFPFARTGISHDKERCKFLVGLLEEPNSTP